MEASSPGRDLSEVGLFNSLFLRILLANAIGATLASADEVPTEAEMLAALASAEMQNPSG